MKEGRYIWTDGTVDLELVPVAGMLTRGMRLTTTVTGAQGNATRFMLDTGSVGSLLAMDAPIADEMMLSRMPFQAVGTHAQGYLGHLPIVRMGQVQGRDLTVAVTTGSALPDMERNILGIVHLFHTQLEHRGSQWTLRSGSARLARTEPGWADVRLESGTPILRVQDPADRPVYALIDSGAYESLAVGTSTTGTYRIRGTDGAEVQRVDVRRRHEQSIDPRAYGGYETGLILGMDVLTSRDWRMTFDESTWAIAPR